MKFKDILFLLLLELILVPAAGDGIKQVKDLLSKDEIVAFAQDPEMTLEEESFVSNS